MSEYLTSAVTQFNGKRAHICERIWKTRINQFPWDGHTNPLVEPCISNKCPFPQLLFQSSWIPLLVTITYAINSMQFIDINLPSHLVKTIIKVYSYIHKIYSQNIFTTNQIYSQE